MPCCGCCCCCCCGCCYCFCCCCNCFCCCCCCRCCYYCCCCCWCCLLLFLLLLLLLLLFLFLSITVPLLLLLVTVTVTIAAIIDDDLVRLQYNGMKPTLNPASFAWWKDSHTALTVWPLQEKKVAFLLVRNLQLHCTSQRNEYELSRRGEWSWLKKNIFTVIRHYVPVSVSGHIFEHTLNSNL